MPSNGTNDMKQRVRAPKTCAKMVQKNVPAQPDQKNVPRATPLSMQVRCQRHGRPATAFLAALERGRPFHWRLVGDVVAPDLQWERCYVDACRALVLEELALILVLDSPSADFQLHLVGRILLQADFPTNICWWT